MDILAERVEKQMADVVGKPLDFDQLDQDIMHLKGLGRFSSLSYEFVERNGQQGLLVKAEENPIGTTVVRPLILVDGSSLKNVTFNLGARVTLIDFGGYRSELRTDFILFSEYGLRSEYYHPFTPLTHWFVAPRGLADNDPFYLYNENKLLSIYRQTNAWRGHRCRLPVRKDRRTARRLRRRVETLRAANRKPERAANLLRRLRRHAEFNTS